MSREDQEAIARLFGGRPEQPPEQPEPAAEGLPPADKQFADYTDAEWQAVHEHAETVLKRKQASEPEHVALARRAIKAAEENPNRYLLDALERKDERNRALAEMLNPPEESE